MNIFCTTVLLRISIVISSILPLTSCFVNNSTYLGNDKLQSTHLGNDDKLQIEILLDNPKYILKKFNAGDKAFIDRPYTYSSVLSEMYSNYCALQTAMDDKRERNKDFIQFTTSVPVTVYVGYDMRSSQPLWLSDWTDTKDDIILEDKDARYWDSLKLRLFKKSFPEGLVKLGANEGAGSMYIVLINNDTGSCALKNDKKITLSWMLNDEKVDGYNIYTGDSTSDLAKFVSLEVNNIEDLRSPIMTFRSWSDLAITDKYTCFSISAYLNDTESNLSTPKCINL